MVEIALTAGFLFIMLAACGVILGLLALAQRADEWILDEIRKQDTDRN